MLEVTGWLSEVSDARLAQSSAERPGPLQMKIAGYQATMPVVHGYSDIASTRTTSELLSTV
jgi:hypothetical protein